MPLIVTSVPTIQSKFADYHHTHMGKSFADSILDTEREYAIACARAEALRVQLIQKQRAREVEAAIAQRRLYENRAAADAWGQFATERPLRRVPSQTALGFDSGLYYDRPYRPDIRYPFDPRTKHEYAQVFATQGREQEGANARFLAALKRQKALERAQAITHAYRAQREEAARCIEAKRRADAKAQQEAQLRALIGPLFGILLGEDESLVNEQKAKCPAGCFGQTPLASQVRVNDMTRDTLRDQVGQQGYPASTLFFTPSSPAVPASKPVDVKGKGRETPAIPFPRFSTPPAPTKPAVTPAATTSDKISSLKDELLKRRAADTDPDVQRTINNLLSGLYGPRAANEGPSSTRSTQAPSADAQNNGKAKEVRFATTPQGAASRSSQATSTPENVEPRPFNGTGLHRTPALSPILAQKLLELFRSRRTRKLSLDTIREIEDQLRKLEASFVFPSQLDFPETRDSNDAPPSPTSSDSEFKLSYTPNNKAVHAYEHALNELLTKLDAVDSQGDGAIRGRRKEVIGEVEKALNEVLRKVEDSRERASLSDKQDEVESVGSRDDTITVQLRAPVVFGQAEVAPSAPVVAPEDITVDTVAASGTAISIEERVAPSEEIIDTGVPETLIERVAVGNEVETVLPGSGVVLSGGVVDTTVEAATENQEVVSGATVDASQPVEPIPQSTPVDAEEAEEKEVTRGVNDFAVEVPPPTVNEALDITPNKVMGIELSEVNSATVESIPTEVAPSLAESVQIPVVTITEENQEPSCNSPAELEDTPSVVETPSISTILVEDPTAPAAPIPAPSSPNPSESSSEGSNSFLLQQTSLLADPEPKKTTTSHQDDKDNDDDEIDVVSAGDLSDGYVDEKDGSEWSEVEA